LDWELLPHADHSPDMSPSDRHEKGINIGILTLKGRLTENNV
ncbi:hypothetical protein WH47_03135, partial [Habropoda laboriosa]